jgi:hypothetical protein
MGRRWCGVFKKADLIDTSRQRVDGIDILGKQHGQTSHKTPQAEPPRTAIRTDALDVANAAIRAIDKTAVG